MDRLSLPKLAHLETLTADDLPHLLEQRQRVYEALEDRRLDFIEYMRLYDASMWLTEQIVYLKAKRRNVSVDL